MEHGMSYFTQASANDSVKQLVNLLMRLDLKVEWVNIFSRQEFVWRMFDDREEETIA